MRGFLTRTAAGAVLCAILLSVASVEAAGGRAQPDSREPALQARPALQSPSSRLEPSGALGGRLLGELAVTESGVAWCRVMRPSGEPSHVALDLGRLDEWPDLPILAELPADRLGRIQVALGDLLVSYRLEEARTLLRVFDAAVPAEPREIGALELAGALEGALLHDARLYATLDGRVVVIDLVDPARPRLLGRSEPVGLRPPLALDGQQLYAAWYAPRRPDRHDPIVYNRLQAVDVSDPLAPRARGQVVIERRGPDVHFPARIVDLEVVDGHLLALTDARSGLLVYDLADPDALALVAERGQAGSPSAMLRDGDRLRLFESSLIRVLDVSDPADPKELGSLRMPWSWSGALVTARHAGLSLVLDAARGLRVLDLRETFRADELAAFWPPRGLREIELRGELALGADAEGSLRTFDVGDPQRMREIGRLEGDYLGALAWSGDHAYVLTPFDRIKIIDVSEPASPQERGVFTNIPSPRELRAEGARLYVLARHGLWALDISDPLRPKILGELPLEEGRGLALRGQHAYVAGVRGIDVVDVSDPGALRLVGGRGSGPVWGPLFLGDILVTQTNAGGDQLRLFDLADPRAPGSPSSIPLPYSVSAIGALDGYLLVGYSAGGSRIDLLDLRDPARPAFVDRSDYAYARDVAVAGERVFVASYDRGLLSFRFRPGDPAPDTPTPSPTPMPRPRDPSPTPSGPALPERTIWLPWLGNDLSPA